MVAANLPPALMTQVANLLPVSTIPVKFATDVSDTNGKFFPPVPLVSLIPVANMTPVTNN
jgi:hypothetical protein